MIDRTTTALVVDSTADLPDGLADDPNVNIVPLTVFFGEEAYLDGVELTPEQFYQKLRSYPALPKTSRPPPGVPRALQAPAGAVRVRLLGASQRSLQRHVRVPGRSPKRCQG